MRYRTITICGPTEESCQLAQDEMVKVLQQIVAKHIDETHFKAKQSKTNQRSNGIKIHASLAS